MTTERKWHWYQARFEEGSYSGPHATREDAIAEGRDECDGDGFHIAEATNPPIRLADWIGADYMLERADESVFDNDRASNEWDDVIFSATKEQEADLVVRIRTACDEWQAAHGLIFHCCSFEGMRNHEFIEPITVEGDTR